VSAAAVTLRLAQATDRQRVWWWRNDPETRRASFDSAEISWDSHRRWFDDSLKRDDRKIYIVVVHGLPEGVARLDIVGSEATVSIHLAPEWRGKGIGAIALQKLAALRELKLHKLVAAVKEDNVASLFAFKKARFTEMKRVDGVVTLQRLCRR
jgi:RimJ/RimL family protein N-acetyltransferase